MTTEHYAALPDTELIEACLKGKSQAWEVLLARYQRLIYSIPLRYGLTEHDANDIFQNVSLSLLENLSQLRDRKRLGAWLVITTRRECWRTLRSNRKTEPTSSAAHLDEQVPVNLRSEDDFLVIERQSLIRAAVEQMGPLCQKLLTMLFYSEPRPPYTRIAQTLSLPEGSIGPTRARCLEKLMKILDKMGFSET